MTETTRNESRKKPLRQRKPTHPLASAPRQPLASEAWKEFADRLVGALIALGEDEYLILVAGRIMLDFRGLRYSPGFSGCGVCHAMALSSWLPITAGALPPSTIRRTISTVRN